MPYCFMNLRPAVEGSGFEPVFPDGTSFGLLADSRGCDFGLYEYHTDDAHEDWQPAHPVSRELAVLIESGKGYPPALALARERVEQQFRLSAPTLEEFSAAMIAETRYLLARQAQSGFLLAQSALDEVGYLDRGEWIWTLGVRATEPLSVYWVSGDYFVYCNRASDFDLTESQIESLRQTDWHKRGDRW